MARTKQANLAVVVEYVHNPDAVRIGLKALEEAYTDEVTARVKAILDNQKECCN